MDKFSNRRFSCFWIGVAACVCLVSGSMAQEGKVSAEDAARLSAISARLEVELDEQLSALHSLRESIASERPTLAGKLETTAEELRTKQRAYDIARSSREAIEDEFEKAEKQLQFFRDERTYIDGLLFDFRKNYEAVGSVAEADSIRDLLKAAEPIDDSGTRARMDLVSHAIERFGESGGASEIPGEALGPEGVLHRGTFVEAGPVMWFYGESGKVSGLVAAGSFLTPEVLPGTADRRDIVDLADGKAAAPRFDPTLGTAVALEEVQETLWQHVRKGGIWIYPILFLALVSFAMAVMKLISVARMSEVEPATLGLVVDKVNGGEREAASQVLDGVIHPTAQLLDCGIEHADLSRDGLEQVMFEKHSSLLPALQKGLPIIAIVAATAPLLGLLGTVTGMIHTFQKITVFGTGDAKPLAGGISEALVTTEFGLIVAIPSLIAHALLSRRTAGIRSNMELSALAFLNGVKPPARA